MKGCLKVFSYLCVGEMLVRALGLPVPGPMLGLLIMLGDFSLNRAADREVEQIFDSVCRHLAILFVPAGAGVVAHGALFSEGLLAILIAVLMGTAATMLVTALCFNLLQLKSTAMPISEEPHDELCDTSPTRE